MNIYDESGSPVLDYDSKKGRLERKTKTIHHEAIEGVEEQGHWVTTAEYPETGGSDVEWVIDVVGVEAKEAWDEEEEYFLYIPYTEEELIKMEEERNRPSVESLLEALMEGIENA